MVTRAGAPPITVLTSETTNDPISNPSNTDIKLGEFASKFFRVLALGCSKTCKLINLCVDAISCVPRGDERYEPI